MLTAHFGWEANGLQNAGCLGLIPVTRDITIVGYQFNVTQGRMGWPGIGQAEYSIVNVYATLISPSGVSQNPANGMGTMTFTQTSGTNKFAQDHSGPFDSIFFTCGSQVNDNEIDHQCIVMPSGTISIPVKAGWSIATVAAHNGFATNLGFDGVIFYE